MDKSKVFMDQLIKLITIVGCVYQIYCQTTAFMMYPVSSMVNYEHKDIRLPAVTFCIAFWYSKYEKLVQSKPIGDAFKLLPRTEEYIVDCSVTLPNYSVVSCSSISKVHKYLNAYMECFSFFESNLTLVSDSELTYKEPLLNTWLFKVQLKSPYNYSNHWALVVRPHDVPLSVLRSTESRLWIEPMINKMVTTQFQILHRHELPHPYPSNCFSYKRTRWRDLDNAVQNCWLEKLEYNGTHYWPRFTLYDCNIQHPPSENSRRFSTPEVETRAFPFANEYCFNKLIRPECNRNFFILDESNSANTNLSLMDENITFVVNNLPKFVELTELVPKSQLSDFINDVGNIISMWIGISLYLSSVSSLEYVINNQEELMDMFKCNLLRPVINSVQSKYTRKMTVASIAAAKIFARRHSHTHVKYLGLINWLIKMISLVITLYFVADIIMIYFENPFYTLIMSKISKETRLAHLTVCLKMSIDRKKINLAEQNLTDEDLISKLTVDELIKLTIDWDTIYIPSKSKFLSSVTLATERVDKYYNFSKSVNAHQICYSSFGPEHYISKDEIKPYVTSLMLCAKNIDIKLNVSKLEKFEIDEMDVYYHYFDVFDQNPSARNRITIPINDRKELYINSYIILPSQVKINLFPDHILSTCRDYKALYGISSRLGMIENCTVSKFVTKFSRWPVGYRVSNSTLKFSGEEHQDDLDTIRHWCESKFRFDECSTVHQQVSIIDKFYHPNYTSIIVYPPKKFILEYYQKLKYSVFDILGFMGGTINSWIGIAVIDVLNLTHDLERFVNSRIERVTRT